VVSRGRRSRIYTLVDRNCRFMLLAKHQTRIGALTWKKIVHLLQKVSRGQTLHADALQRERIYGAPAILAHMGRRLKKEPVGAAICVAPAG
jgi:hypothetical protein